MQQQKITDIGEYEKVDPILEKQIIPNFLKGLKMIYDMSSDGMIMQIETHKGVSIVWVGSDYKIPTMEVIEPLRKIWNKNCHLQT